MNITFKLGCWLILSSHSWSGKPMTLESFTPGSFPKAAVSLFLYVSTGFIFPTCFFLLLLFVCLINKPNETVKKYYLAAAVASIKAF